MKVNLSLKSNGVNNAALRIALIYASFSVLWILFSDQILLYFIRNAEIMTKIQMIKGWFFVLITALLIYFLLRKEIYKYKQVEEALRESENNYRTLVECANSVILKWDTKGNIIYLNPYVISAKTSLTQKCQDIADLKGRLCQDIADPVILFNILIPLW